MCVFMPKSHGPSINMRSGCLIGATITQSEPIPPLFGKAYQQNSVIFMSRLVIDRLQYCYSAGSLIYLSVDCLLLYACVWFAFTSLVLLSEATISNWQCKQSDCQSSFFFVKKNLITEITGVFHKTDKCTWRNFKTAYKLFKWTCG